MKIVLAEEQNGSQSSEKTFSQAIIRIGRDPVECQIQYDNAKYPMVSRKHAELRFEAGRWILHDLNSSYGTYVNGQRVVGAQAVAVGNLLQFGTQGPSVRVLFLEADSAVAPQNMGAGVPQSSVPTQFQQPPPVQQNVQRQQPPPPN